jgi:predicted transcriptional regulator
MGVRENIRWLRDNKERAGVFVTIAKRGPCKMREVREYLDSEDWWQAKSYVTDLVDRDLVAESESRYRLTEAGEKAFESLKTVHDIESV